jgi:phosphoribosylanthranilate isomerase
MKSMPTNNVTEHHSIQLAGGISQTNVSQIMEDKNIYGFSQFDATAQLWAQLQF